MKDGFVQQCLEILKRDDIKRELKGLYSPIIDIILFQLNPYIYFSISVIVFIFIMVLAILILLILILRNKNGSLKIY
jgi:hypothetical protein